MPQQAPVSVVGLGAMGSALARALLRTDHPTTVWNRTPSKADALVAEGAQVADSLTGAVTASPLTVVCLLDYDKARQALVPAADNLAGRTVVNLSNGTPRQAREYAAWTADHGADYLDGGIMAIPPMIGGPAALILYSGNPDVFTSCEPTLADLGTCRYLGADPGLAGLYDLALLSAMYGMFGGFVHAASLVGTEQVSAADLVTLLDPWLRAMLPSLTEAAAQIDSGNYGRDVSSPLAMQATALANIVDSAREQGIRADIFLGLRDLVDQAVAAGHDHDDFSSLIEVMKAARPSS